MIASPLIPQFHQLLGPLFRDAGLPDGVLQILNFSEEDVEKRVEQLVAHENIRVGISQSLRRGINDR
jgi:acyl-CoA reductase-like NAD-dependent aldehyde dehydrogenase